MQVPSMSDGVQRPVSCRWVCGLGYCCLCVYVNTIQQQLTRFVLPRFNLTVLYVVLQRLMAVKQEMYF